MSNEHWPNAYNKLGLVQFYLRRALKHADEMTPEMIAAMLSYADHAFAGLREQVRQDSDWCASAMHDMREAVTK